jgi:acyl-CoA-binding protein
MYGIYNQAVNGDVEKAKGERPGPMQIVAR